MGVRPLSRVELMLWVWGVTVLEREREREYDFCNFFPSLGLITFFTLKMPMT